MRLSVAEECHVRADATLAAPLVFSHALSTRKPRRPKRLFRRFPELYRRLQRAHQRKHPGSGAMLEVKEAARTR